MDRQPNVPQCTTSASQPASSVPTYHLPPPQEQDDRNTNRNRSVRRELFLDDNSNPRGYKNGSHDNIRPAEVSTDYLRLLADYYRFREWLNQQQDNRQGRDYQEENRQGRDYREENRQGRDYQEENRQGRDNQEENRQGRDNQEENRQGRENQEKNCQGRDYQENNREGLNYQGDNRSGRDNQETNYQGNNRQGPDYQGLNYQENNYQLLGYQENRQDPDYQGHNYRRNNRQGRDYQESDRQGRDYRGYIYQENNRQGRDHRANNYRYRNHPWNNRRGWDYNYRVDNKEGYNCEGRNQKPLEPRGGYSRGPPGQDNYNNYYGEKGRKRSRSPCNRFRLPREKKRKPTYWEIQAARIREKEKLPVSQLMWRTGWRHGYWERDGTYKLFNTPYNNQWNKIYTDVASSRTLREVGRFNRGRYVLGLIKDLIPPDDYKEVLEEGKWYVNIHNKRTIPKPAKVIPAKKKYLTRRELHQRRLFKLPKTGWDPSAIRHLQKQWSDYIQSKLNLTNIPSSQDSEFQSFVNTLLRLEYTGSKLKVVKAVNPSHVGLSGVVVLETRNAFQIVNDEMQLKILPKEHIQFDIVIGNRKLRVWGKVLIVRPQDRGAKKIKNHFIPDF